MWTDSTNLGKGYFLMGKDAVIECKSFLFFGPEIESESAIFQRERTEEEML